SPTPSTYVNVLVESLLANRSQQAVEKGALKKRKPLGGVLQQHLVDFFGKFIAKTILNQPLKPVNSLSAQNPNLTWLRLKDKDSDKFTIKSLLGYQYHNPAGA